MMLSHVRRALRPVEIGILEEVSRIRPDVKRDAYRKFLGDFSESKLARAFSRLTGEGYIRSKEGRRGHEYWVLSFKAKSAVKRARAAGTQRPGDLQ